VFQPDEHAGELIRYINLKLAALGQPISAATAEPYFLELTRPLLRNYQVKDRLLADSLCPADARIQSFLDGSFRDICPDGAPRLPAHTFILDRAGLARVMSVPATRDSFSSPWLRSYRIAQGVLHNPHADRRTTQGIFHIVEGGLPIPADKIAVPRTVFVKLLAEAFRPPTDALTLPFTADQPEYAGLFVSLHLRPLVCPATATEPAKSLEVRFFAPASLVSNLDFVEAIFGNAGDPYLPENDAALDVAHWTGHSGCVILAPHLIHCTKKDLGLPHFNEATERQRRDGQCWRRDDERYNNGNAFKITCRDAGGVMVTLIADNYYGYCKKEIKTQISFAANLYGLAQEEHAGGAIAFPSYVLGQDFAANRTVVLKRTSLDDALNLLGDRVERRPGDYAVDTRFSGIYYVPEDAEFNVRQGFVHWQHNDAPVQLTLRPGDVYVLPSGYRVYLEKQAGGTAWRLIGTRPDGTLCHKPSTVSGGGKSEISKSIGNVILKGPVFVRDYYRDLQHVSEILTRDYSNIFAKNRPPEHRARRPILSLDRSLGSVIKLLTPSPDYTDEHNDWLRTLPQTIRQLVYTVKRYYRPEWGESWREHFTVDHINGHLGHELRYNNQRLVGNYLRVGYDPRGSWRIFKLRPDFHPAEKVQVEDDITVSVVLPREQLPHLDSRHEHPCVKLVENCESMLFQRPDDAIHPGVDRQAEGDLATPGTFVSNFEPLDAEQARGIVDHIVEFDQYSEPMQRLLADFVANPPTEYVVCSAYPRLVDGKPSKNPRYLQRRPDMVAQRETYLAEICTRLDRAIPADRTVHFPITAVLAGRRGNPPDPAIGLPPLAVYSPIHYQELPELFMDLICSLTGKSPSTTGFGSEGALTKGPFNALPPIIDLNNALVDFILTGYGGFTTAAGYIGPEIKVEHDISMLVPEIWCRMRGRERDPQFLIENGYLEPICDFEWQGRKVHASRLGYRITALFADRFLGRIFETPDAVFSEAMLQPEKQSMDVFVSGVDAIVDGQCRVAKNYFEDGSIDAACPPLRALLHIMAEGHFEGRDAHHPEIRAMFSREALLESSWYRDRLLRKQQIDIALWKRHVAALETAADSLLSLPEPELNCRLQLARTRLTHVVSAAYLDDLKGTIGA
jgi:hypothetical protein